MVERIRIDANLFIEVIVETSHLRRRGLLDELVIPLGAATFSKPSVFTGSLGCR